MKRTDRMCGYRHDGRTSKKHNTTHRVIIYYILVYTDIAFVQVLEGPASTLVAVQTQQVGAQGEMAFRLLTLRKQILETEFA
jgi:hypothetical protein